MLIGFFTIFISGCGQDNNTDSNQKKEAITKVTNSKGGNDNIETLSKLISLPQEPLEAHWELIESNQESQSLLVGLRFSKEVYENIVAKSEPLPGKVASLFPAAQFERWIPKEAQEQLKLEHTNGLINILNVSPRKPDLFTQTLSSPFIHGELISFSDEFILLSLYSM